jgi:hypothetical protein
MNTWHSKIKWIKNKKTFVCPVCCPDGKGKAGYTREYDYDSDEYGYVAKCNNCRNTFLLIIPKRRSKK